MARITDAWSKADLPTTEEKLDDLDEGEDADGKRCLICCELESASRKILFFVPCTHAACEGCVQKLRRVAVCKDVKGVMCPYCRQAIEKYSDVKPARRAMKKPVPSSHHLKATRFHLKVDKGCPKGKPRIPALYGWNGICSIGGLNDYAPPPNVTGADGPGLKPNRSEEGLLDNFQGFPLKPTDNLLAMSESVSGSKQIHYNLLKLSGKNQKKLVRQLLETIVPHARRLATHSCGNYTVQRMLGFASQHRGEIVFGECGYTAFVRSLCKDRSLVDIACHEKGMFVVQKMVHCMGSPVELRLAMDSVQGKVSVLANSPNACFSLERIVEVCIVSISRPADRAPYASPAEASKCLCRMALELCATKDLVFKAQQATGYPTPLLLVECLRWSANEPRTRTLLLSLARHAPDFAAMGNRGKRFLQGLLSLDIPEVAEAIIECFVGAPERPRAGQFASFALDGREVFFSCLGTPCVNDEYRDLVVKDLLSVAAEDSFFLRQAPVLHAFCVGLSLLPPNMLKEHVDILKALGCYGPKIQSMIQDFQAEYCIQYADLATLLQPQQQRQLAVIGQAQHAGFAPGAPNGHVQSPPSPPSSIDSFPPLGAPQASPPSAGAAYTSASVSQREEGSSEGPRASRDSLEQGEGQGESVGQASEAQAGQGRGGDGAVGVGTGGEQKAGKKEGASKTSATAVAALPTEKPPTAAAAAAAGGGGGEALAGGGALSDQGRPTEVSGAATEPSRPTANGAGKAQGTHAAEGLQRASSGTAGIPEGTKPGSHPSEDVLAVPLPMPGVPGLGPKWEGSQGEGKQGPARIRAAPLPCAGCNVKPACMVIVDCRHLSSCSACAPALTLCPFCTGPISELVQVSPCTVTPQNSTVTQATGLQQAAGPRDQASGAPQKAPVVPLMPPGFAPKVAVPAVRQAANGVPQPAHAQPAMGVQPWQAPSSSSSALDAPTYGDGSRLSRHSSQEMHVPPRPPGLGNDMANTAPLASDPQGPRGCAPVAGSGLLLPPGVAQAAGAGLGPMFPPEASSGPGTFFQPGRSSMPASFGSAGASGPGAYSGPGLGGSNQQPQLQQQLQQQMQHPQQQQPQQFPFPFDPFHPLTRATYPGAPGAPPLSVPQGGSQGAHPGYTVGAGLPLQGPPDAARPTESYFELNFPFLAHQHESSAVPSQQAMPEPQTAKTVIRPAPYLPPGLMDW